jgi:N6-L-threonylcarbamoyladenine synthase
MIVLGVESSCDETGVALVAARGRDQVRLLAHGLHSQAQMHKHTVVWCRSSRHATTSVA